MRSQLVSRETCSHNWWLSGRFVVWRTVWWRFGYSRAGSLGLTSYLSPKKASIHETSSNWWKGHPYAKSAFVFIARSPLAFRFAVRCQFLWATVPARNTTFCRKKRRLDPAFPHIQQIVSANFQTILDLNTENCKLDATDWRLDKQFFCNFQIYECFKALFAQI